MLLTINNDWGLCVAGSSPVSPTQSFQVFRPPFEIGSIKLYKGYNARILEKR